MKKMFLYLFNLKGMATFLILMFVFVASSSAQLPQYYNYNNVGTSSNIFPFSVAAGKQVQWLFLAGDFNQPSPAPSGYITKVYFFMTGTASGTFTDLTIKLGQTTITSLPPGVIYTGPLDTVYHRASVSLSSTSLSWMSIALDKPFAYDSTKSLVVDVSQCGASLSGTMSLRQNSLTPVRRTYINHSGSCVFVYAGQDGAIVNCGVDIARLTPQHYNFNTPGGDNSFPLNQPIGKMVQWLVAPGEFNQPSPALSGGAITGFYFRISSIYPLGPATYTSFFILFGQTPLISLPTGSFYTGQRDTVYKRSSVTLQAAVNTWLFIPLDNPYPYNPAQSLVIQVEQCGATGTTSGYSLTHTNLTGYRRCWSLTNMPCPWSYQGQGVNVLNCGINISYPVGIGSNNNNEIPNAYKLEQNYPNPFNPVTNISFALPKAGNVKLVVYDMLGREVATLLNDFRQAGSYTIEFDASELASGIYMYKMESGGFVDVKKMSLVK